MNVLLIDDHAMFRHGIRLILARLDSAIAVFEADSIEAASDTISSNEIDLTLLDLGLRNAHGIDSLVAFKIAYPNLPVIVLSGEEAPLIVHQTVENGAMGFISKAATHEELLRAVSHVIQGGVYLPLEMTGARSWSTANEARELSTDHRIQQLSKRQKEVLYCLLQGKSNKVISGMLNIAENTVKNHIATILKTMGAKNRTEVVYLTAQAGVSTHWPIDSSNSDKHA